MKTQQMDVWSSEFGEAYTQRNSFQGIEAFEAFYVDRFGKTRTELNEIYLGDLPKSARILEVGCNIGNQLHCLRNAGFENLFGVELQQSAVEWAHTNRPWLNIVHGSAFDIPFKDQFFDVVFTNNVLIHIAPTDLANVLGEMHRVTRRHIWGFEYYAPELVEIPYRGETSLLWKGDYPDLMCRQFEDLKTVGSTLFEYQDGSGLVDKLYLLERVSSKDAK